MGCGHSNYIDTKVTPIKLNGTLTSGGVDVAVDPSSNRLVVSGCDKMHVYETSRMVLLGTVNLPYKATYGVTRVAFAQENAVVDFGHKVANVSLSSMQPTGTVHFEMSWSGIGTYCGGHGLAVYGNTAIIAGYSKLLMIDIASQSITAEVKIKTGLLLEGAPGLAVDHERGCVVVVGCNTVSVIDIRTAQCVGSAKIDTSGFYRSKFSVALDNGKAYVAGCLWLLAVDLATLTEVGRVRLHTGTLYEGGVGLAMRDSIAFIAGPSRLLVIDTTTMKEKGAVKISVGTSLRGTVGVAVDGDYVYVAGTSKLAKVYLPMWRL
eukprot:TRINITY_DN135_c0_g1_i1.p1 TRINITY_DN135_c0_g1~~TRINITY_DN135_c0_g1_i1.p1  ORF type:complete len:320 (+),score=49.09 TRINITY_DN135_c0_g1_i1:58-1017(+)